VLKNSLALLSSLFIFTGAAFAATPESAAPVKAKPPVAQPTEAVENVPFHGVWEGRFSGDSEGNIKVTVSADNAARVICVTDETGRTFELEGPVRPTGEIVAVEKSFGPSGLKVRFKGMLTPRGTASGTWENAFFSLKGEWQTRRIGGLPNLAPSK
jgi:hypothetical protein